MASHTANTAPETPAGRRTVLLLLDYGKDAIKSGVYDHARRAGWRMLDLSYYTWEIPRTRRVDGVLCHPDSRHDGLVRRLVRLGVPVVQIDDFVLPEKCCCVVPDRRAIGRLAAEHFAQRGFGNMAYLHSEEFADSPFKDVGLGFAEHARRLGATVDLFAIQGLGKIIPWARLDILAKRLARQIARLELPLGIFTYHDVMAIRICQLCDVAGLKVPEEVAVLGNGNDPYKCEFAPMPLSSVDVDLFGQARTAAELLGRMMDGEPAPTGRILTPPAGVAGRQSTDVLAVPDAEAASALRYMWEHLAEPLTIGGIAEAVGISRRKLERHFRQHLHRSVNEELMRKRIERACELLTSTKATGTAIAEQVGFGTEKYFYVMFRKLMGTTPRQYRLANRAKGGQAEDSEMDSPR